MKPNWNKTKTQSKKHQRTQPRHRSSHLHSIHNQTLESKNKSKKSDNDGGRVPRNNRTLN